MKKLITLLIILIFITGCTSSSESAEEYYSLGVEEFNQKEFTSSYNNFEKAFQTDSNYFEAYIAASDIFIIKDDLERAKSVITKGLSDSKEGVDALTIKLADIQYTMTEYDIALSNYEKVLSKDSKQSSAIAGKAKVLIARQKYDEARSFLQQNLVDIKSSELALLGLSLFVEDKDLSSKYVQELLKDPQFTSFANSIKENLDLMHSSEDKLLYMAGMANTFLKFGYYVESLPLSLNMLAINPYYEMGLVYKSIGLINIGQQDIVVADLEFAKSYNPSLFDTHFYLAEVYYELGQKEKSFETAKSSLQYVKNADAKVLAELLYFYQERQESILAKDLLDNLSLINAEMLQNTDLQIASLILESSLGNYETALTIGTQLLDDIAKYSTKDQVMIYCYIGYVKFNLGYKSDGLDLIHKSQSLDNTYPESYAFEGIIYTEQHEYDKAQTVLAKAIDLDITGRTQAKFLYEDLK